MKNLSSLSVLFPLLATLCVSILTNASVAWAQHPGIATNFRDSYQGVMAEHIKQVTEKNGNGKYPIVDPDTRTLVQLTFKEFHDSVEVRGRENSYFISCSDFVADDGTLYDVDFLISEEYGVVSSIVHAKAGKHKSYDVN